MDNDYSLEELGKLLVEIGRKKHGNDYAYPFALGTIIGMIDINLKYRPTEIQRIINEKYVDAQKELAVA